MEFKTYTLNTSLSGAYMISLATSLNSNVYELKFAINVECIVYELSCL
jgi:hypothetical protein